MKAPALAAAALMIAAAQAVAQQQPVAIGTSSGTTPALSLSTAPAVSASSATVTLTTAALTGSTTGLNAPTLAPGASFTPPGAVQQGYNSGGASFTQPGTLTPQLPPGATLPATPSAAPTPTAPPTPASPGAAPTTAPKTGTPATAPQTSPQAAPQSSPLTPQRRTRADVEATHAAYQLTASEDLSLRRLDEENVERHRRLHEQYLARRKLLTDSDDWKFSSWSERRAQLKALKKEYNEREEWLRDDYVEKRDGLLNMSQGGFDDIRVQGAD